MKSQTKLQISDMIQGQCAFLQATPILQYSTYVHKILYLDRDCFKSIYPTGQPSGARRRMYLGLYDFWFVSL